VNWLASVTDIAAAFKASEHKKAFLLDLSNTPSGVTAEDIEKVVSIATEAGSTAVAAVNADGCAVAANTSLPLLMGMSQPMAPPQPALKAAAAAPSAAPGAVPSLIYTGTVRSGQQLYAEGTSLVVIGSVNNGAELLADGDIHVYGKLAGRAIAGLSGDESARVFARTFQPSLVGIANGFATIDDLESSPAFGKFVSVGLKGTSATLGKSEFGIECDDEQQLVLSVMD
jgi:septum site-determining protein MinC